MRGYTNSKAYNASIPEGYEAVVDEPAAVMLGRGGLSKFGETDDEDLPENWLTEAHSHSNQTQYVIDGPPDMLHTDDAYELEI